MASTQDGNLGLWSGYTAGDNGWAAQHNANWDALDALAQLVVKNIGLATPPGSPANGDAYIVPAGATGAWASQTNKIAAWQRAAWVYYTPKTGWIAYAIVPGGQYLFDGTTWASTGGGGGGSAMTVNNQTGTSYTFALGDANNMIAHSNASAITDTIPPNASVAFVIGTQIPIMQKGAGQVTVAPGAGVTLNKATATLKTRAQYSVVTIVQVALDSWVLVGDAA